MNCMLLFLNSAYSPLYSASSFHRHHHQNTSPRLTSAYIFIAFGSFCQSIFILSDVWIGIQQSAESSPFVRLPTEYKDKRWMRGVTTSSSYTLVCLPAFSLDWYIILKLKHVSIRTHTAHANQRVNTFWCLKGNFTNSSHIWFFSALCFSWTFLCYSKSERMNEGRTVRNRKSWCKRVNCYSQRIIIFFVFSRFDIVWRI